MAYSRLRKGLAPKPWIGSLDIQECRTAEALAQLFIPAQTPETQEGHH